MPRFFGNWTTRAPASAATCEVRSVEPSSMTTGTISTPFFPDSARRSAISGPSDPSSFKAGTTMSARKRAQHIIGFRAAQAGRPRHPGPVRAPVGYRRGQPGPLPSAPARWRRHGKSDCGARPMGPRAGVDGSRRLLQIGGVSIGLLIVAWACSLLYSDDMGALAVYYGPDGGTHIAIRRLFVESDPKVYAGFVSLYAVMDLLERILSLVPPGSLVLSQGRRGQRGPRLAGLAAFSIAWCWCLKRLALPVLSNIQVDGFYAHFFGFLPLALRWVADVLFRPTLLRLFWVGLGVLLLRFTYGLNLGDVLITCGIVWLFDAVGSRRRVLPLLAGLGALGAGIVAYLKLAP